jgi:hypothetical protein
VDGLLVAIVALGGALFSVSAFAAAVGGLDVLISGRFERCPRCGHYAIACQRPAHPDGCPAQHCAGRVARSWAARLRRVHLRATDRFFPRLDRPGPTYWRGDPEAIVRERQDLSAARWVHHRDR